MRMERKSFSLKTESSVSKPKTAQKEQRREEAPFLTEKRIDDIPFPDRRDILERMRWMYEESINRNYKI